MSAGRAAISVLCVEDNLEVARALEIRIARWRDMLWLGHLPCADDLLENVARLRPDIVLMDVDMPGKDPFVVLPQLYERQPQSRAILYSGHVHPDLIAKALDSGAWGYVSKNDDEEELAEAIRRVAQGRFVLGPEIRRVYGSGI